MSKFQYFQFDWKQFGDKRSLVGNEIVSIAINCLTSVHVITIHKQMNFI